MSLLHGLQSASQETQGYRSNEFQFLTRDFYRISAEVIWPFQLIGCPVVFFLIWISVKNQGDREDQRWSEQPWHLVLSWCPLQISERSYPFL